jgi:hypothetical protein
LAGGHHFKERATLKNQEQRKSIGAFPTSFDPWTEEDNKRIIRKHDILWV